MTGVGGLPSPSDMASRDSRPKHIQAQFGSNPECFSKGAPLPAALRTPFFFLRAFWYLMQKAGTGGASKVHVNNQVR